MPTDTTRLGLKKGLGSDNARDYMKTELAASLDIVDKQGGHPGWKGADIASAAALALGADASFFHVTGVVTITSISSRNAGEIIILEFDGAVTLTHNAVSLILLSGANTTTQAGDVFVFVSEGGGNWREVRPRSSTLIHGAADHTGDVLPAANQALGAFFIDIDQLAAPANPVAGTRRIFVDSADGKLKVRTSGGASTSLEESGAASPHGAADHSGDVIPAANQDFGAFYSDITQIAAPANPAAGTRRVFVDSADGKLKVRTSGGASTSLEEQGALPTSATADVTTSETTTSTAYTDLTTAGPSVTLSPGASRKHLILISTEQAQTGAGGATQSSVAVAGVAAVDADSIFVVGSGHQNTRQRSTLSASVASGSTHTMKYRVTAGTGTFLNRRITAATQE